MARLIVASLLTLSLIGKPELHTRAFPPASIAPSGSCSTVLLTAEISGEETEAWYCPTVTWTMPDGTESLHESDCPPWEEHEPIDYERRWTKRVCAPAHPYREAWEAEVRLSKAGKTIARQTVRWMVH